MGVRETVRSLRAYFMFSGPAGVVFAFRVVLLGAGIFLAVVALISVGFSLAFAYFGFTLPKLLRGSAGRIGTLLYASAGWSVFCFLLSLLGGPSAFGWYLLKNVRRLAAESQAASCEPPSSGDYGPVSFCGSKRWLGLLAVKKPTIGM